MIDIRPAEARAITRTDGIESRHSFAFGAHYDASNTGFGPLVVSNEDLLAPGAGFASHPHRELEIVTWVLEGELTHRDDHGNAGVVRPGLVQRMSAGTGIVHEESNASVDVPVRYVQMWVLPAGPATEPAYTVGEVGLDGLVPVVRLPGAVLWAARLTTGERVSLPEAPLVHLFVATGEVLLEGAGQLAAGDAARLTDEQGLAVTATATSELLVWELHPG